MKLLFPLTLTLALSSPALFAKDKIDCTNTETLSRSNIEVCLKQSDDKLNKVYRNLMNGYKGKAEPQDLLKKAQRAWIVTRDSHCTLVGREVAVSAGVAMAICELKMTQYRTKELQELFDTNLSEAAPASADHAEVKLSITDKGFRGIAVGDKISAHSEYSKKDTLKTGEGDFEVYRIEDFNGNVVGYFDPDPNDANVVGSITVEGVRAETAEGIKVGSTFQELKEKIPSIKVHGSEIEGRTHAVHNKLSYRLDVANFSYNMDATKIPADTKVVAITIDR